MKSCVIKDLSEINQIKEYLSKTSMRDYVMFTLGINTGLRLQNLLQLKFSHFFDGNVIKDIVKVNGQEFLLNDRMKNLIVEYKNYYGMNYDPGLYMFSRKKGDKPLDRSHVYRILNECSKNLDLEVCLSTQSLRKTFGFHYYINGGDINILKKLLGQNSCTRTFEYIEIEKKELTLEKFFL